jgi:DNA repair exonuclease SbcCD ATPase subunit
MLKVVLKKFRAVDHAEYTWHINQIGLVKGPSGKGKSTIMYAIAWALYGGLRGVDPLLTPTAKTSVALGMSTPWISIQREKRPEKLTVWCFNTAGQQQQFDGEAAQAEINRLFGPEEVWYATSFLEQGSRASLLSASASEKLKLIESMIFGASNIDDLVENLVNKITTRLQTVTRKISELDVQVKTVTAIYEQEKASGPVVNMTSEQIHALRGDLATRKNRLHLLQQEKEAIVRTSSRLASLSKQLADFEHQLSGIAVESVDIEELRRRKTDLQNQLTLYRTVSTLLETRKNLLNLASQYADITLTPDDTVLRLKSEVDGFQTQLMTYNRELAVYNDGITKSKSLGVEYDLSSIAKEIKMLEEILSIQVQLQRAAQYRNIKRQVEQLPEVLPVDANEIASLSHTISKLQLAMTTLECPGCKVRLRFQGNSLTSVDVPPPDPSVLQEKTRKLSGLQDQQNRYHQYKASISMLQKQLADFGSIDVNSPDPLTPSMKSMFENKLALLRTIRVVPEPVAPRDNRIEIQKKISKLNLLHQIELSDANLKSIGITVDKAPSEIEISEISQKISSVLTQRDRRQQLQIMIEKTKGEIATVPLMTKTLEEISLEIAEEQKNIQIVSDTLPAAERYLRMIDQYGKYTNLWGELAKQREIALKWAQMQSIVLKSECDALDEQVEAFNNILSGIVSQLFDSPITVALSLYRELKTGGRVKPQVNLTINYQGVEYTNLRQLSGGEGDRISFALTVALNVFRNSPILLLDESFASIDLTAKDACIRVIRESCPNRYILCVVHDGIEGIFDSVLTL